MRTKIGGKNLVKMTILLLLGRDQTPTQMTILLLGEVDMIVTLKVTNLLRVEKDMIQTQTVTKVHQEEKDMIAIQMVTDLLQEEKDKTRIQTETILLRAGRGKTLLMTILHQEGKRGVKIPIVTVLPQGEMASSKTLLMETVTWM